MKVTLTQILLFPVLLPLIILYYSCIIVVGLVVFPFMPFIGMLTEQDDSKAADCAAAGIAFTCLGSFYLFWYGINFHDFIPAVASTYSILSLISGSLILGYYAWELYLYHLPESLKPTLDKPLEIE